MKKTMNFLFLSFIIPLCLNIIVYYGFSTHFTRDVFSEITFSKQYDKGIYRYRVLSKFMLIKLNKVFDKYYTNSETKDFLKVLDTKALKWTPKSGQKYNLNIPIFELIINIVWCPVII